MENQNPDLASTPSASPPAPPLTNLNAMPGMPQPPAGLTDRIQSQKPRRKMPLVIGLVVLVILVLVGVGGWWWYAQGQALLLHRQMKWTWGTDLVNYKAELDFSFDISTKKSTAVADRAGLAASDDALSSVAFTGFGDGQFKIQVKSEQFTVGQNTEGFSDLSMSGAGSDGAANFALQTLVNVKFIDRKYFIQAETLDLGENQEFLNALGLDLDKILGVWLTFDLSQIPGGSAEFNSDQYQVELLRKVNDFWNKVKDKDYFTIRDPHQNMTIEANELKRLDYVLKPERADALLVDFRDFLSSISTAEQNIAIAYDEWKKNEAEQYQQLQDILTKISYSLWINADTKVIHGLELAGQDLKFSDDKIQRGITLSFVSKTVLTPIEFYVIQPPAESQNFFEFFDNFMTPNPAEISRLNTDSDSDGLSDMEEGYYGSNWNLADSDGDGYTDGEEVKNGYDPNGPGKLAVPLFADYQIMSFQNVCLSAGGAWQNPVEEMTWCVCPSGEKIDWNTWTNLSLQPGYMLCQ